VKRGLPDPDVHAQAIYWKFRAIEDPEWAEAAAWMAVACLLSALNNEDLET